MASSKSQNSTLSTSNNSSTSTGRQKEDLNSLKTKIAELERQIVDYKTKLDELRRAKATTVVKFEKEYVNAAPPGSNRPERSKPCDKCDEFEKIIDNERKSNAQLKKLIENKEKGASGSCQQCPTLKQFVEQEKRNNQLLTEQLANEKKRTEQEKESRQIVEQALETTSTQFNELKSLVEALKIENQQYQKAFDRMKEEHEHKMAELFQREEEAKKQVATWEQMYREWMATMERRVNNLQVTNEELQNWFQDDSQMASNRRFDNNNSRK